jgi:outer membrane protein OmpA-like peptidoglycan-associated protein
MKHILVRAPAIAALFIVACAGSQKELTAPQQAAAQAEEQAQKAQNEAQKAREEANKAQKELGEAQQTHDDARRAELTADQKAQQASMAAEHAEQAALSAHPPQPAAPPPVAAAPPAPAKGVAEAQAAPKEPSVDKVVVITAGLLFKSGSAELSDSAKPKLDKVANALKAQSQASNVTIEGYTDDTGKPEVNEKLSQDRAQAVADYLEGQGVPKERLTTKGLSTQDPVSTAQTPEGRALNRRVDIVIQSAGGKGNENPMAPAHQGSQPQP